MPSLLELPRGCKFSPRCPYVKEHCTQNEPTLLEVKPKHNVRCFMRDPATAHMWEGVQRVDWRFEGDEVFVDANGLAATTDAESAAEREEATVSAAAGLPT